MGHDYVGHYYIGHGWKRPWAGLCDWPVTAVERAESQPPPGRSEKSLPPAVLIPRPALRPCCRHRHHHHHYYYYYNYYNYYTSLTPLLSPPPSFSARMPRFVLTRRLPNLQRTQAATLWSNMNGYLITVWLAALVHTRAGTRTHARLARVTHACAAHSTRHTRTHAGCIRCNGCCCVAGGALSRSFASFF